jgi:signal transduction histidine kinase
MKILTPLTRLEDFVLSLFSLLIPSSLKEKTRKSIYLKTLAVSFISIGLFAFLAFFGLFVYNWWIAQQNLRSECELLAVRISNNITEAAWNYSNAQVETVFRLEIANPNVAGIVYTDFKGDKDYSAIGIVKDNRFKTVPLKTWENPDKRPNISYEKTRLITKDDFTFGKLTVYVTDYFVKRDLLLTFIMRILMIFFTISAGIFIVFTVFKQKILDPIVELNDTVLRFQNRDFDARAAIGDPDEIGTLANNFNDMADMLKKYSESLESLVDERTGQLFQAEKMASLGEFVASISHDINTPVGICLTTATYMMDSAMRSMSLFSNGTMARAELEQHFSILGESLDIMQKNLTRIHDLVQSFRKIASDRYIEEKREFNVKEYLSDILISLKPKLRRTKHTVTLTCSDSLVIETYPGSFSQIIMNLFVNSLTHAFEPGQAGNITIHAESDYATFILTYSDDGRGIPRENIEKIFDPFFTTKREEGGTGLGLSTAYSVVTQMMAGTILCESIIGKGTTFTITIPDSVKNI